MNPTTKEKILTTLSYFSFGIIGFVLLLIGEVKTHFMKYHVYQSILIGLLVMFLNYGIDILSGFSLDILGLIPGLQGYGVTIIVLLKNILHIAEFGMLIYCVIGIWRNQYTWIKWISEQIHRMI
ncbi:MAG: hypothetical protein QNJ31_03035 [Candidatus Caenarcaniphilales bacterium]|nr:hypothetical protein [Candidatus Caenarcaniphilales bacterium]